MSSEPTAASSVVRLRDVTKTYGAGHQGARWRAAVPGLAERVRSPHVVLDSVDLDVERGEAVGLIGPNGAGKSTVLKVVAGVTRPDRGTVEVQGALRSMIELGIGFHPDLTGWENAWASLVMHGHDAATIRRSLDAIAEFAGIEDAMDSPVKQYSLGMQARLAFSVATHTRPDVLVVDEVLAVGDRDFQLRCIERIREMVDAGTGLIFVSHEMPLVARVCSRVVHLRLGRVVDQGPPTDVVGRYLTRSPSRYRPDPALGVRIGSSEVGDTIEPFGRFTAELAVTVDRRLREPKVGVDMSLPAVAPDLISMSSLVALDDLAEPGTYRLVGTSNPIGFENADLRMVISVVDGIAVADTSEHDVRIGGGRQSSQPEVSVVPVFSIERTGDATTASTTARRPARVALDDPVLRLTDVTKTFRSGSRRIRLRAAVPGRAGATRGDVEALTGVSFEVGRGEAVGLIGANGSGKSTLLRAVAGLHRLDRGSIAASEVAVPILDPGAGFHNELTGRENIARLGAFLGIGASSLAAAVDGIGEFAGLGDELDAPVRTYSSGMRARLGMSVALAAPGRLLLIDELLAVGDEEFRRRVLDAVTGRVRDGETVLFVSHELRLVEQLCDRVVRLEHGHLVDDGPASDVIDAYGGASWAGGVHDATSGVRLLPLAVRQRHIRVGGRFEISGELVVEVPTSTTRLELAFRGIYGERPEQMTAEDRARAGILRRTLEPSGGALTREGTYRFELDIDRNEFCGTFDVVIAVIDERDETICAETWQELKVGEDRPEGFPGPVLEFDWRVSRLPDPPAAAPAAG